MAGKVASIFAEIGLDTGKFSSGANTVGGMVSGMINSLAGMSPILGIVGGAFTALAAYMMEAEKAAVVSAEGLAKQEAILKATGYSANTSASELNSYAQSLSRLSGIDDEAIISAESLMLTFRNIGRDTFPVAMQAAVDLQTTFGSLESSSMQLGKALNDPIKGITALGRAGVTFSEEQKAQIKGFVETNQLAEAQGIILQEVQKQVGGTAAAIEKAGDGSNRVKVSYENLSETIGNRLIPAQRVWNTFLADTYDIISKTTQASYDYGDALDRAIVKKGIDNTQNELGAMTAEQYGIAIRKMAEDELYAGQVEEARIKILRDMGYQVNETTGAITLSTEKIQQNEEEMTKANEATLKGVEVWQSLEESFTDKLDGLYSKRDGFVAQYNAVVMDGSQKSIDAQAGYIAKISETNAEIDKLALAHEIATKRIVLGYIEQKMAADGNLDDAEREWLLAKGVEWGVYKQSAIDAYRTASAEADEFAKHRLMSEGDRIIHVRIDYANASNAFNVAPTNYTDSQRRAAGGPASGMTLVGERGPEIVNLPGGSFVNSNNTSRNMMSGGGYDTQALIDAFTAAANANRFDPYDVARILRDELQQVRR